MKFCVRKVNSLDFLPCIKYKVKGVFHFLLLHNRKKKREVSPTVHYPYQ